MIPDFESLALAAFRRAADRVPAYRLLLQEAGVRPGEIRSTQDFARLPVLEKQNTFQRFRLEELCVDGNLGRLASVLTSSGHSGIFAFGLFPADTGAAAAHRADDSLDMVFAVRSRRTLLINCLPMGVKFLTEACTLAETSVRPDMAVGLVKTFGPHFDQIILVGEAAFLKHLLETGERSGVKWRNHRVNVIAGEEPLAENARKYFEAILGHDLRHPENGAVASSMGVAELGLNLFAEAPPLGPLLALRRTLHENPALRRAVLGDVDWVPSIFTYDPGRIFVEFDATGKLLITTLEDTVRIPLVRYATGDRGGMLRLSPQVRNEVEAAGISWDGLQAIPLVAIQGRGDHALAAGVAVYPEAVKEGIYHDAALARLTTANFRLVSGSPRLRVRIQLSPGISPTAELEQQFTRSIANYVRAAFDARCEKYEAFGSGMSLDYERKFQYLGP